MSRINKALWYAGVYSVYVVVALLGYVVVGAFLGGAALLVGIPPAIIIVIGQVGAGFVSAVVLFYLIDRLVESRLGELQSTDTGQSSPGGPDTGTPLAVVEAYFDLVATGEIVYGLLHSRAPIRPSATAPTEVEQAETEVRDWNLDRDRLRDVAGDRLEEADIDALAGENALVAVEATLDGPVAEPEQFLVAPEDGEWQIVLFE